MTSTRFTKAHACGNDFLIVQRDHLLPGTDERSLAIALCARNTGVGADGVEYLSWTRDWTGDRAGSIRLYNADGSIAEISGNGTRCVAAYMAHARNAVLGETITLDTDAGPRACRLIARPDQASYEIATRMGVPTVASGTVVLDEEGITVDGAIVSTGNPHFVIFVQDESFRVHGRSWQELGRAICFHPDFPEQTNVEFVYVRAPDEIAIRIFERGVGPTSSSGTGTCATSAAAIALRGCATCLAVEAPGGTQQTEWLAPDQEILLTGSASIVAQGEAFLEAGAVAQAGQ